MKKFKAFSILETLLVLSIIGISISIIVPIWKAITISQKLNQNEEKFEYIRHAMQAYLLRYGYLPTAAKNLDGQAIQKTYKGNVPYKTLGIKKKYAFDARNQPFTYAVNEFLTQQENCEQLPVTMHFSIQPSPNQITFCRFYEYENNKISRYDKLSQNPGLTLLSKGESIIQKTDCVYIMREMPKEFIHKENFLIWLKESLTKKEDKFKNCNQIAWLLISHGPAMPNECYGKSMNKKNDNIFCIQPEEDDIGVFNDQIFYQTRFDMAAQINCPCTVEPIYESIIPKFDGK